MGIGSDKATILLCERGKIAGVPGKGLIRWVLLRCGLFSIQLSLMVDWAGKKMSNQSKNHSLVLYFSASVSSLLELVYTAAMLRVAHFPTFCPSDTKIPAEETKPIPSPSPSKMASYHNLSALLQIFLHMCNPRLQLETKSKTKNNNKRGKKND